MSEENVEVVRLIHEAWNRDPASILRYIDPEVDFNPGLLPPGEDTRYVGHDGVRKWIANVRDAWVAVTVEPQEAIEVASDRVLAIDRWSFEGRDGIEVEEELPTAFTLRDGLVVRVDGFTDKAEALEAAGLSE
jgi:ketosteroid isomerase-like protein